MNKHWLFKSVFSALFSLVSKFGNGRYLSHVSSLLVPIFTISKNNNKFLFYSPNPLTRTRGETLFTKEPETIAWIDDFKNETVFYDIGANVGIYSIYAGISKPGIKIFSFEPTFFNYGILNRNIYLNNLDESVSAICLALSDKNSLDYIYMPEINDGSALVNFGSNLDYNKKEFNPAFMQGALAFSLDNLITQFNMPIPDYIKIDVDGLEKEIVLGSLKTLKNSKVKSILIELNEGVNEDKDVVDLIKSCGFSLMHKKQGPAMAGDPNFAKVYNYIFTRE